MLSDRIFHKQTVGKLLADPDVRFAVERALRREGFDLVMPPDVPCPGDEFLNGGDEWRTISVTSYEASGYGKKQYIARRPRAPEAREMDRQSAFFFPTGRSELPDGWVIQLLQPGSYRAHGPPEVPSRLAVPLGLETPHYRHGLDMPDGYIRLLLHHEQVGLAGDKYIEVDVPLSAVALFNYECDPVSGLVAYRVYRSGHREVV